MKVFKFGGASVNSAQAVSNMASILKGRLDDQLVVVISAMGKTTNKLEQLVPGVNNEVKQNFVFQELATYHQEIVLDLIPDTTDPIYQCLDDLLAQLKQRIAQPATDYNFDYDQVVSFGEIISTTIISHYLNHIGIRNEWVDVRSLISTDTNYREGHVDWQRTQGHVQDFMATRRSDSRLLVITQGFIAGTDDGTTTTLGREGSDYSASILSYCLDAENMTIWKDVPGFLNADPRYFRNTVKIKQIPYNEAIELAYYGASVIHPKTVKPIQNKHIELHIKSFITPDAEGSVIGPCRHIQPETPLYIFKNNQVLLSIMPNDFSFIAEDNMQIIFGFFAQLGIRVNLMQNSALSFSVCIDNNPVLLPKLRKMLQGKFKVRYNEGLQLITIRYYTQEIIDSIVGGRKILLEQRSRSTEQLVVRQ